MGRRKFASLGVYRSLVDSPALKEKPRRGAWVRVIGSGARYFDWKKVDGKPRRRVWEIDP